VRYDTACIITLFGLAVTLGAALLAVSQDVQNTQVEIARLERETHEARDRVHTLEVEWHALNRPDRLEALMEAHGDAQAE
jgi:hypothetical protein